MASFCRENYVYNAVRTHVVTEILRQKFVCGGRAARRPGGRAAGRPGGRATCGRARRKIQNVFCAVVAAPGSPSAAVQVVFGWLLRHRPIVAASSYSTKKSACVYHLARLNIWQDVSN